jgi:hypothetical protein
MGHNVEWDKMLNRNNIEWDKMLNRNNVEWDKTSNDKMSNGWCNLPTSLSNVCPSVCSSTNVVTL